MHDLRKLKPLSLSIALAFLAPWTGAYASAQPPVTAVEPAPVSADDIDAKDGKDGQKLEVVTVVGEKTRGFKARVVQVGAFRDSNILDVPLTISVMTRALLDSQDAQGLYDALKNSAGVTRSGSAGLVADNLAIRGIDINNRTSYRLNGGLPINNLIALPMEDKERIEALKGSSAMYYGFTSPSGVVNMVTKRAKTEPVTTVSYSGNEFGQWVAALDVGRKFGANHQYGIRVNVVDGELRDAIAGTGGNRSLAAIALDWRASDSLTFKFDSETIRKTAGEQAGIALLGAVNGVIALPRVPDPTKLLSGTWARWVGRAQNTMLRADYRINDNWAATVEVGHAVTYRDARASTSVRNYNLDTGAGSLQVQLVRGQKYANTNYRAELAGRFDLVFDQELILGYMANKRYQNGPSQQTVNIPQNLFNPVVLSEPAYTLSPVYNTSNVTDNGIYALDRIRFNEQWQLLLGIRKTDYTNATLAVPVLTSTNVNISSPSAGLIYKVRPDTSIYATYIEGLEEGATAGPNVVNAFQILPPGVSKQKELGIRSEAIPGLSATVAAFTLERATSYTNTTTNTFVLDGRSEYKGVEYSLSGEVSPELSVYLSGLFIDAKQKNAANATLIDKVPENTAKQTHSLFAEYSPKFLAGFSVNGGAYYIAKRPVNAANNAYIPGYTTFTLGARYATRVLGRPASFQVNVENAADKRSYVSASAGLLGVGLPRTVKFSTKVDF